MICRKYPCMLLTYCILLISLVEIDSFLPSASIRLKKLSLACTNIKTPKGFVKQKVVIDGEEYVSLTPFSHHPTVAVRHVKDIPDGIKVRRVPNSNLTVTQFGIGTATFGDQVDKEEAFKMLDIGTKEYALNLIDTSEVDPIPYQETTKHTSETYVGNWLKKQSKAHRDQLVISSKICGWSNICDWIRRTPDGQPELTRINKKQVVEAVNAQLKRLNVDHIDILQFQWPERYVVPNGEVIYNPIHERPTATPFVEQLEIVDSLVKAGKVRYFGLSNETPYGIAKFATLADVLNLPRPITLQCPYSLIDRFNLEHSLMEPVSRLNENLGVITYSPLAGGALTGKYEIHDRIYLRLLNTFRLVKYAGYQNQYLNKRVRELLDQFYLPMAKEAKMPLSLLALAWIQLNPFILSTLLGASNAGQLVQNIQSINCVPLHEKAMKWIKLAHEHDATPTLGDFPHYDPNLEFKDLSRMPFGYTPQDIDEGYVEALEVLMKRREEAMSLKPPPKPHFVMNEEGKAEFTGPPEVDVDPPTVAEVEGLDEDEDDAHPMSYKRDRRGGFSK